MIRTPQRLRKIIDRGVNFPEHLPFVRAYQEPEVQAFLIKLNIRQLFVFGQNADGRVVGTYTQRTEEIFGPPKFEGEPYNFKWTGKFFKTFKVIPRSDGAVTIQADDRKTNFAGRQVFLTEIFGNILGFTDDSKGKISRFILPFINREIRVILFAK